jgi:hypothetical protein
MDTKKVTFNINGEKYSINLPKELRLRETQNCIPNHICALFNGQPCCLKINIQNENGQLSLFEMTNCSKNPEKRGLRI